MKKIYLFFIIFLLLGLNINTSYWNYNVMNYWPWQCYNTYFYNNNFYRINVPCSRDEFIRLEFAVYNWSYLFNSYEYKLVFLNQLLIKKWLEPLYY